MDDLAAWQHPLGFVHIELTPFADGEPGERLRLHVWPSVHVLSDAAGNIHEHTWSLTSLVLRGALRDCDYRPVGHPGGAYHGARVAYGSANSFVPTGTFDLDLIADRHVQAGSVYTIPPRMVHRTQVVEAPTVTLVLTVEDVQADVPGPLILSRTGQATAGTPIRQPLTTGELRSRLVGLSHQ